MKRKHLTLLMLLAMSTGAFADNVPAITVEYIADGTPAYVKAISAIGSLQFANGKSILVFADNTTQDLGNLADLKQIRFGEVDENSLTPSTPPDGIAESKVNITVYPNPTASRIKVDGAEDGALIRLFTIGGQLVKATTDTDIDMSAQPEGEYLLQTGACVIKILKK